ncbi:hypothetical protein NQ314_014835 [Rhamnusium bicolor]|uniref:Putative nuclease HARBI1 n=1 Tax=Rhamnusium bicolor TaxID=1586634 RepID=A0AAV8WZZ7_9CUCU|nr:hypothetical protein NQ314_014835 [Rhamnusium bicolor]
MFAVYRYLWAERERLAENERLRNQRRVLRDNSNPFNLPEARFIELFRLNKASVLEIEQLLIPHLQRSRYRNAVPPRIKIFTALRFFATGSYQRSIGEDFNLILSQTAVHRCIHEVTDLMNEHLPRLKINFPQDRRSINDALTAHVAILKPDQDEHNFLNRKGYHSLNVQIICDATMKILNINANFPGASHDSFIWRQSQVRNFLLEKYNNGEMRGTWLLGDSGYPLEPFLMVPFHENAQQPQNDGRENFNRSLQHGYRIYLQNERHVEVSCNVIFDEKIDSEDSHMEINCKMINNTELNLKIDNEENSESEIEDEEGQEEYYKS